MRINQKGFYGDGWKEKNYTEIELWWISSWKSVQKSIPDYSFLVGYSSKLSPLGKLCMCLLIYEWINRSMFAYPFRHFLNHSLTDLYLFCIDKNYTQNNKGEVTVRDNWAFSHLHKLLLSQLHGSNPIHSENNLLRFKWSIRMGKQRLFQDYNLESSSSEN